MADKTEEMTAEERHEEAMERRAEAKRQEDEAAAVFDSPAYAKGPQDVPAAGSDPDSLMRSAKHAEAATRDLSGAARGVVVDAAENSGSDGDGGPDGDGKTAAERAAEERAAQAHASGSGQAATVHGRKATPKSST